MITSLNWLFLSLQSFLLTEKPAYCKNVVSDFVAIYKKELPTLPQITFISDKPKSFPLQKYMKIE